MLPIPFGLRPTAGQIPTLASPRRSSSRVPPITLWDRPASPTLLHRRAASADPFGSPAAADAATQNGEEDQTANAAADADDDVAVTLDPGADFFSGGGASALTVGALASTTTGGTIEEVLLHAVAHAGPEFRGSAGKGAILTVAGVGVVPGCE